MATTLGSMSVGDVVKIAENGTAVSYIIVHKGVPNSTYDSSCDGVWLLREQAHSSREWCSVDSNDYETNTFETSTIYDWLNSDFLDTIDSKVKAQIKTVKLKLSDYTDYTYSYSCKAFLLSLEEVLGNGIGSNVGLLSYFTDYTARKCTNSSGTTVSWWLRTPGGVDDDDIAHAYFIRGTENTRVMTDTDSWRYARPAFILPTTLNVDGSGNIVFNTAPTISGSSSSGSNLGEKSAPFSFTYKVADADNDTVTVKEYLDSVLQRSYTASLGSTNTFQATYNAGVFQKILNGSHTLKVTATDSAGNSSAAYTVTFNKQVRTAAISLSEPLPADDVIKAAVLTVTGSIPQDASLEVLVTNNALDDAPVWEDMTQDCEKKINHVFANSTAANGFAFNFKVTVTRGASEEQGYISNIGGAFE